MSQKQVNIAYRDVKIMYEVDRKTVTDLATHYGISWEDMKSCMRQYGFVIRKGEQKPANAPKPYTCVLTDTDKIVVEPTAITIAV